MRLRLFSDADYEVLAAIKSSAEGEPVTADGLRRSDAQRDPSRYFTLRVVAELDQSVIGYGETSHNPNRFEPMRLFVQIGVDPRHRRRGVGSAVWEYLRARLPGSTRIVCRWADDGTPCASFLRRHGFREVIRAYEQVLDVSSFDLRPYAHRREVLGIAVSTLRVEVGRDQAALAQAYELFTACRLDQPTLGHVSAQPFAAWRDYHVASRLALLDGYFLALSGPELVGNSSVQRDPSRSDALRVGITGVLPQYRRRGIGLALKLAVIEYAHAHGYAEIHTSNSSPNVGMLALNETLGFRQVAARAGYELAVQPNDVRPVMRPNGQPRRW